MHKKAADKRLYEMLNEINIHLKKFGYPENTNRIIIANDAGSLKTRSEKQAREVLFETCDLMYFTDDLTSEEINP